MTSPVCPPRRIGNVLDSVHPPRPPAPVPAWWIATRPGDARRGAGCAKYQTTPVSSLRRMCPRVPVADFYNGNVS